MNTNHTIIIAGHELEMPLYQFDEDKALALFVDFNDLELIKDAARELLAAVPDFDLILTEDVQGIPLAYEMSRQSGKNNFIVARQKPREYMSDVVGIQLIDYMEADEETEGRYFRRLYLSKEESEEIDNKRVLLVDDAILHGRSLRSLETLVNALGGYVVGKASLINQPEMNDLEDVISLVEVPIFQS